MVLGPVAAQLGNKRLVIVADGALQYVPFAMLPVPESGRVRDRQSRRDVDPRSAIRNPQSPRPLIVDHEIISLPSASTLAVQRKEFVGRKPAAKMVAVIADPVFSPTDDRLNLNTARQKSDQVADAHMTGGESVRILGHLSESSGTGRLSIPRLPFTRREADQIISVSPGKANLEAVDFKASRATVTSGELKDYRYLHFATHGYLDSERPALSAWCSRWSMRRVSRRTGSSGPMRFTI